MARGDGGGRPPIVLDDLRTKRILDALRSGHSRRMAAAAGGVSHTSLQIWYSKGRNGDPKYVSFFARMRDAEYQAANQMIEIVWKAARTDPKYATWWLERRLPEDYGKQDGPRAEDADADVETEAAGDLALAESVVAALKSRKTG
jgi:hypothetical protein